MTNSDAIPVSIFYRSFGEYLADDSPPRALHIPPGGKTGNEASDASLCMLAEMAKRSHRPHQVLNDTYRRMKNRPNDFRLIACERIKQWIEETNNV